MTLFATTESRVQVRPDNTATHQAFDKGLENYLLLLQIPDINFSFSGEL